MSKENPNIKELTVKDILGGSDKYVIPVYQRNYAWGVPEVTQLIQDVIDSLEDKTESYYLGTLVVSEENDNGLKFKTIDGQQRLTTLYILTAALNKEKKRFDWFQQSNLTFDSREKSMATLDAVFTGTFDNRKEDYNVNVKSVYDSCILILNRLIAEKNSHEFPLSVDKFIDYLYTHVKILRVSLPKDTDLNHYFEIMNSRGEQLEKHEILKANLMSEFNGLASNISVSYKAAFHLIWEACSNMEKYVQYGFTPAQRDILFGKDNWDTLQVHDFDTFIEKLSPQYLGENARIGENIDTILVKSLDEIIDEDTDDSPDRFNSVINFQNFLIHVLRVQTGSRDISLDDKKLITVFKAELNKVKGEEVAFVKEFIFNLFKCKFLMDKYIIKREFTGNTEKWSLKKIKLYNVNKKTHSSNRLGYVNTFGEEQNESADSDNRRLIILLSMFHVSTPTMVYKHWFNAALYYLFHHEDITSKDYILYLEHIAKAFVFDKHIAKEGKDYFDIIYGHKNLVSQREEEQLDLDKLRYGNIENNLIFNFLDYLLWSEHKTSGDAKIRDFAFSARSSVEHFYPQNPIGETSTISDEYLHSFGNLCLISHDKNSKLSNYLPDAKATHYRNQSKIDSIKQYLMIGIVEKKRDWAVSEIVEHNDSMTSKLTKNLNSTYEYKNYVSKGRKWFNDYKISNRVLLVRALLCFDDITVENGTVLSGNGRYNLYDWSYIETLSAYEEFINYVDTYSPASLQDLIKQKVEVEQVVEESDFRYLFIKYSLLMDYCANGNFGYLNYGYRLILLESDRASDYKSKEAYMYLLEDDLRHRSNLNISVFSNVDGMFLNLQSQDNSIEIIEASRFADKHATLRIYNIDGASIGYHIEPKLAGNYKIYSLLNSLGWVKNRNGHYFRPSDEGILMPLSENHKENYLTIKSKVQSLINDGLKIDLSWQE